MNDGLALSGLRALRCGELTASRERQPRRGRAGRDPVHGEPYLLEDASVRESPDGSLPLLSALVVLQDSGRPSNGFLELARRAPYKRPGDDTLLWVREIEKLAEHYGGR